MIWNILVFINSINMSFNSIHHSIAYATIAFIYFFMFSFFEGILFYFTFNMEERNSLIKMMIITAIAIISFFIQYLLLLRYPLIITLLLVTTFIPQIIFNARLKNKQNLIPKRCIVMFTLNRLYIPLYIRMVPNNMFRSEKNYFYSIALIISHIAQIAIIYLQEIYGGDWFIPKRFKGNYFDYKVNMKDVIKANKDFNTFTCSICLEAFVKNENNKSVIGLSKESLPVWNRVINRMKLSKPLYIMMTPCKHYFHVHCLLPWISKKKCPICRMDLPQIL